MNKIYLERFVYSFIRKSRRERILYELTKPERRYDGISRFCHQAKELLDPSKIVMEGDGMDHGSKLESFVRKNSESCLVLSPDPVLDEQILSLEDALNLAISCTDAVLILGSTFVFVFTEAEKGGRERYLLSES